MKQVVGYIEVATLLVIIFSAIGSGGSWIRGLVSEETQVSKLEQKLKEANEKIAAKENTIKILNEQINLLKTKLEDPNDRRSAR